METATPTAATPAPPSGRLPRTVIVLGLVSFLNDAASDMITPLLPVFLTAVLGAGPAIVGLVEGIAEATSSILKLVSGRLVDRGWNPKRLVMGGYTLSNGMRPLLGLAAGWGAVLLLRFLDRVGKGVRTAPRDALIAAAASPRMRGRAFGFHRALDHGGAMVGPLLAFGLLGAGVALHQVFLLSAVPGVLVLLLLAFGLPGASTTGPAVEPVRLGWRGLDRRLRALVLATGGLALATTPEVFLVLWAQSHGMAVVWVPLLWALASAVKAAIAMPAGNWSDRVGRLPVLALGWGARIGVLIALALASDGRLAVWGLFLAYAASLAFTEGAERALIGDHAPLGQKGAAYGLYHMVSGLFALPGALLFGALWQWSGPAAAFLAAAGLTALSVVALLTITRGRAPAAP
ncbi:MAG: MFS transporter [Nitrospirae bacterium]|nr:MFS transporter [Nitrospirota bacterium]